MLTEDYGIPTKTIQTPLGSLTIGVARESDGETEFPVPEIADLPITLLGRQAGIRFSLHPAKEAEHPLWSRGYELEDSLRVVDCKGRTLGYVYLEDPANVEANVVGNVPDAWRQFVTADVAEAMLAAVRELGATEKGFRTAVDDLVSQVEKDCLRHRAETIRQTARELFREADNLDLEAARLSPSPSP